MGYLQGPLQFWPIFCTVVFILGYILCFGNAELTPPYFNLATGRKIYATATCGVGTDGPELYCKLTGASTENDRDYVNVLQGQVCDVCDPNQPDKHHPPENAINGKESWWQSPPLSRGMKYNEVNLTIDFGQEFHVAYLFIRMGNSPRPGLWTLEKSSDYGKTWTSWQHFSDTPSDCETYFGRESLRPIQNDNDVICTTEYSKIVPLENGEIPVTLLNDRPSANNYFNSAALQEWTRATNVRIRLLRTKNLLGHLMSVARQDPTVTRRYFYSIKDISIGGRCMCNGHADTCDVLDPKSSRRLLACRCQHRTCGIQCNECCPGFEQKKWRQNTKANPFECEPCNCFGHSNHCVYDEEMDVKGLSLDIHGNYDGGGVCQNCQHNTEGTNCNKCKPKFYRPYGKYWNETDVCRPCNCDYFYSTGNCEEETGRCECRKEFQPPHCDTCAYGFFGYPNCRECECNLNGTDGYHCEASDGACPCLPNFAGHFCKECAEGYYAFPECKSCECNTLGSISNDCDFETGQCKCLSSFGGKNCERCKDGYYSYPNCKYCDCDLRGTMSEICDKDNGKCLCRQGYGGPRCDQCLPGYYNYPDCVPCNCSTLGSTSDTCDVTGKCNCLHNFAGKQCNHCSAGFYLYPECLPCNCNPHGTEGISCNSEGQCLCHQNFDGKTCDLCKEGFYNFPVCEECNCDPAGVIAKFAGCGSVPAGELCQCKERVTGRICDQCKPLYWNLNITNSEGCESCDCYLDGTIGSLDTCDTKTGQCTCKPSVHSRQCKECKDGTYDLFGGNLFGCKDCSCDIGGSRNPVCDKISGQCLCHPRVTGRTCTHPLTTHYFPTLYQFQFEYEDGYTPSGTHVRYQYDEEAFPEFSGKGYAVFSNIQNNVINEVTVFKSSVYRMVIRYMNPSNNNITADILITSDNPVEVDQSTKVLFKPTRVPQFVTVSGSKGFKPSPVVLDPGRYTISIKTAKNVLLDYFVLLPAAYYEASILTTKIENPCELGNLNLCKHYQYPSIAEFKPSTDPYIFEEDNALQPAEHYADPEHLSIINHPTNVAVISDTQRVLKFFMDVPHSGRYVIVVDYITDRSFPDTNFVKVRVTDGDANYGIATLYPCLFTTPCRQPVVDDDSREKMFFLDLNQLRIVEVYQDHDDFGSVGILSVTAIPVEQWSVDYIHPNPVCVVQDARCVSSTFRAVPESKKIEMEFDHEDRIAELKPTHVQHDDSVKLIYLDNHNATISINSKVTTPGRYVIVVRYYEPNHPKFAIPFRLETGKQSYEGKFDVVHCPSSSGCRGIIRPEGTAWWFDIDDDFVFTLTNNRHKGVWMDYIMIVPVDQYHDDLLEEETFDQTQEFIKKCGQDHFYIPLNATDFCKKAVFSLTSDYNNGALPCHCDYDGSTSFECDPFGGQCQCKPNVIGRQCDACRTGFYGFPDCKHCDCPLTALCEKDTGECLCPPHVTGEKCDQCEPYTYGFHQIIGCEECNCHSLGVYGGNLQCDLHNGSCQCRPNIEGRACDQCINGFYNFPNCEPCDCNIAGTTFNICDKTDERCFCKPNVVGRRCDICTDGTYNLQATNPDGCTKCFCFGKTTRCESAFLRLFNVSMMTNSSITDVAFNDGFVDVLPWDIVHDDYYVNETTIHVDFSLKEEDEGFVYFRVLDFLLNQNNHLTAYGGHLVYTLNYVSGPFGKSIFAPDVILYGKENVLFHESYEQPVNAQNFRGSVKMIESSFQTIDKKPVSREDFMMVLRDLKGILIRANYWEQMVVSHLSDVYLTMADEDDENYQIYQELPVEKCFCPPGYAGYSCEDCAPGYYRDPDGPFGGYCIPCQCNGHADTCDCSTGICKNCQHSTTGDHCEMCIEGYHGNATFGTPHDCMICACPLPLDSNNFATSCEISEAGNEIHCECRHGYTGARCESCAPGFYGQPEKKGDYCKPCECSGNINPTEPGSCDTITGECLMCLNNTYGRACNLCAPGYYGDAVKLKDCKSCDCEDLGTLACDSHVGTCVCHENVIGPRCDRCEKDHYGYDSGSGCRSCDCGIASYNTQCNDHTGECQCKPGVTGRQCDRCAADFWNYTVNGCTPCGCNKGYSRGFGCNSLTGQCECLPGVIGEKCDACPHRWVLIKEEGCSECDACHHALLDVTDRLRYEMEPVIEDFQSVALAYFTDQKLNYYNKLADDVAPLVRSLDPKGVNLNPSRQEIESLEMDAKNMAKKISYNDQSAKDSGANGKELLSEAGEVLDLSRLVNNNVKNTINEVQQLSRSFDTSVNTVTESALAEADGILKEISEIEIDLGPSTDQYNKSNMLLYEIDLFILPVKRQSGVLDGLKQDIGVFSDKLEDLHTWSVSAINKSAEVDVLNQINQKEFENSKFDTVLNLTRETQQQLEDIRKLLINGNLTLNAIDRNVDMLNDTTLELKEIDAQLGDMITDAEEQIPVTQDYVNRANDRADQISAMANDLFSQYSNITSNSEPAIKAATAYSTIVDAVLAAQKAVENAKLAAGNATELGKGVRDRASQSGIEANQLLIDARNALVGVRHGLEPHLNTSAETVKAISDLNKKSEEKLIEINLALDQIPTQSLRNIWDDANDNASEAIINADEALEILAPIVVQAPRDLEVARNMSKDVDITNKDIVQTTHQVDGAKDLVPRIRELMNELTAKQNRTSVLGADLGDSIEKLKRQIEMAREIANGIKVGMTFLPTTVLELKTPEALPLLATTSRISAFFNTSKPNGFIFFLGNEKKPGSERGKNEDFMALEVENGYPVLIIDLGNGPEKIVNSKYVADGQWYQAIVERTGNNAKLIIREELDDGTERLHEAEQALPGPYSVYNVDKNSRLFVGGYPPDFSTSDDITSSSFEGQIEDFKIGDEEIGLWNFVDAQDNYIGARFRNKLTAQEVSASGYRFNGNGYVVLDAKPFSFRSRSSIHFRFKASKDSENGIMFYAGKHRHFISVELKDGGVYFQYKLGQHLVSIGTQKSFNDDQWHKVEADRDGRKGLLKVDGQVVYQEETPTGTEENLKISEHMYFGGFPGNTNHSEVGRKNFDGCIDDVVVSGRNVDLSRHIKAIGVRAACPEKFSTVLSYPPHEYGYLRKSNVTSENRFHINLKFKTRQKNGIIFYAANEDQTSSIGLNIHEGFLVLRSMKYEVNSGKKRYNDGEWHVVTATHDGSRLRMAVDDTDDFIAPVVPPPLYIYYGDIYFGGLPRGYRPAYDTLTNLVYFAGCISDVTVNSQIVNFANTTDRMSGKLDNCPSDILDYDVSSVPLYSSDGEEAEVFTRKPPFIEQQPPRYTTPHHVDIPEYTTRPTIMSTTSTRRPPSIMRNITTTTTTTTTIATTTRKPVRRPKPPPLDTEDSVCALPIDPEYDVSYDAGYRFIGARGKRIEVTQIPQKFKKSYDIALEFRADNSSGVLLYAADARHTDFIALYLSDGHVHHSFRSGRSAANIISDLKYNDGQWHRVEFSRNQHKATLIVGTDENKEVTLEDNNRSKESLQSPIYMGGVDVKHEDDLFVNTELEKGTYFKGCIRNLQIGKRNVMLPTNVDLPPCSTMVEPGVFFGKSSGHVRLRDSFHVGTELAITFDFKPRTQNGLLFSVHGKHAFLIIQLYEGSIVFSVKNDEKNMIEAKFTPEEGENFCDGKWRTVQAIKSQYVITLTVDSVSSEPAIGMTTKPSTDTSRPLFMGGHPYMERNPPGLKTQKPFHGCIRNLKIRDKAEPVMQEKARGDVWVGVCPTN